MYLDFINAISSNRNLPTLPFPAIDQTKVEGKVMVPECFKIS